MRSIYAIVHTVAVLAVVSCTAGAAPEPRIPPLNRKMPAIPVMQQQASPLPIGPGNYKGPERRVAGKLAITARTPPKTRPATVEVFVDGKSVGTGTAQPFRVEFDTTTVPDGEHTIKLLGRLAGKDIWNASMKVTVVNSKDAIPPPPASKPMPTPEVRGMPPAPGEASGFGNRPLATSAKLDKTFDGGKYGFTIQYPSGWTFRDKTAAMKPASPGGCWIVFGAAPIDGASIVVNVRRERLQPGTDAETFAKANPYTSTWERRTVMDSPTFSTTTVTPGSKKLVHRMIIIKGAMAWMLNCVDITGKSDSNSSEIFESMISTLK